MKKLLFLIILFTIFFAKTAMAYEPITFAWTPNSEPTLAGYKIYYSSLSGTYSQNADVGPCTVNADGNCEYTLADPPPKLNYYAATAYDDEGFESDFSNEISARSKMTPPGQLRKK